MTRGISLILLGCTALTAQDAREIVRRAVKLDEGNYERARVYSYQQRVEERKLDDGGVVRSVESKTYQAIPLAGEPYRRLVLRNDRPLSAAELREEQEKLAKETSERQKAQASASRYRERRMKFMREVPEAFNFRLAGEEVVKGRPAYVVMAEPRPEYRPADSLAGRVLSKVRGKLWIDKTDFQWVKAEAEVVSPITFGLFLARLAPGAKVCADQIHVNDEVWMPQTVDLKFDARVALVKHVNQEMLVTFKEYKKPEMEVGILPGSRGKAAQN